MREKLTPKKKKKEREREKILLYTYEEEKGSSCQLVFFLNNY